MSTGPLPDPPPRELAAALQDFLGQKLVAFALGERDPRTIGRYARGERSPDDDTYRRLLELHTIVRLLETPMSRQAVKAWMLGANPHLHSKSPIEALHEGRSSEVMMAAVSFLSPPQGRES